MTILGRLITLFPTLMAVLILAQFYYFVKNPSIETFAIFLLTPYVLPLILFRLHKRIFPQKEGLQKEFSEPHRYCSWWGGYHIQMIYCWLPQLEQLLILIPGAFSLWLRLWGSKIGEKVVWTPQTTILDRDLLDVGDRVIFGYQCVLISHVVFVNKKNQARLFVKKIKIGSYSFVGAGSQMGPGSDVPSGSKLPALTKLTINQSCD